MSMFFITRTVFLGVNIILLYIFLTPGRSYGFQILVFVLTWIATYVLRPLLYLLNLDPLLVSYLVGLLYLLPCVLIFKESFHAKFFIFFMIFSLTQLTFLVFTYIDHYLSPAIPQTFILAGLLLEAAALPLIKRYMKSPVKDAIEILTLHNLSFTLFPVLSFVLLTCYAIQKEYLLSNFITLVLSTILIFFSYYLIATTISKTRRHRELELISMTDSLTGLYNRRYMEKKIEQEYEQYRRTGLEFAIVSADIDFFKKINDVYGHDCGDYLLKSVTEDLRKSVRTYDTVARWGGEEFLLLLPGTSMEPALILTERIRKTVEARSYEYEGVHEPIKVTLTFGVSVAGAVDTFDKIIKRADMALYHGKRKSRNCVISFDEINKP